jgi:hypothetical protein
LLILHEVILTYGINIVGAQINSQRNYQMKGMWLILRSIVSVNANVEQSALQALDLKNSAGIILDLRDNPAALLPP